MARTRSHPKGGRTSPDPRVETTSTITEDELLARRLADRDPSRPLLKAYRWDEWDAELNAMGEARPATDDDVPFRFTKPGPWASAPPNG